MVRNVIVIVCLLLLTVSCGRKSGRRSTSSTTQNYQTSQSATPQQSTSSITNKRERDTQVSANKKILTPTELFAKYNSAVFMIYTSDGYQGAQGSGFFISSKGLAVSNYHVFKGSTKGYETIKLTNNKQYKVEKVIKYDDDLDYILFQVDLNGASVNHIPVAKKMPLVGEKAYAIGSPRGLENTFSSGEISQIRDKYTIQISVPIDHGSSGGALLNSYGEAIGITTAGMDNSGANLNFAMSIKVIE